MKQAMAWHTRSPCARHPTDAPARRGFPALGRVLLVLAAAALAAPAEAAFHLFRIDQVYSNADGTVQYVVMREATGTNGESFWRGNALSTTSSTGGGQQFTFPADLPSTSTASKSVLIATSGFAALGLVAPDYTIPNGFVPRSGGSLNYANVDSIALPALPSDGATAIDRNGTPVPATPKNFAGATTTLTAAPPPMAATPDLDQHGLTGSWFKPAESGQGVEIEFFPDQVAPGTALVSGAWFTYDANAPGGDDRQRWYSFFGNATRGAASIPVTIGQNVGGNFAAPPVTNLAVVGSGTLTFRDCSNGSLAYQFADGRSGTVALTRLTPNVTCVASGTPATNADFSLSGNWYDPTTSGQGFVFDVNPLVPIVFFAWYTYAPDGQNAGASGERWYTGQGAFMPGSRTMTLPLYETTGGIFDQATPPGQATSTVGSATVTFTSCTAAQLQYNFTAGTNAGRAATISLQRIGPVPPGCVSAATPAIDPPPPMYPPGYVYGPS